MCPGIDAATIESEHLVEHADGIAVKAGAVEFYRFDDGVAIPVVLVGAG